jgi:hypothetical protein
MDILHKILKPKKAVKKEVNIEEPVVEVATEAMVESIKEEAPYKLEPVVEKVKVPNPWTRPLHHPDCTCFKCERWREAEKNA